MTLERLPRQPVGLLDVVRHAHPWQAVIVAVLICLAFAGVGIAPGFVTVAWLALVTPSLVIIDLRQRRLPNVLVVPGLGAVLIDGCWASVSSGEFPVPAALTTSIVAAVMLALNLVGGLGMGDVKLSVVMAGCLSLVVPILAVSALMLAFLLGGAYSAALLLRRRELRGRRIAFGPLLLSAFWAVVALRALSGMARAFVS
ncbi:Type IV leader peptidase family protein [Agreia bicolorata]|uniref:Type IV leader peptidase family protein n=1 Tax=Agreia bicolorata TaxID=110935 RepID=A0A1T4YCD3_9MICO|nr:prepilin peptidase [Agreia bicolorata]SKA99487.1 Type IV leader peptidase family protein [Agreia bicolorata]